MCMYVFMYECMYVYIIKHEHKRIHVSVYYISELLVSAWENYPGVWSDFYRGLLEELLWQESHSVSMCLWTHAMLT